MRGPKGEERRRAPSPKVYANARNAPANAIKATTATANIVRAIFAAVVLLVKCREVARMQLMSPVQPLGHITVSLLSND